MCILNALCAFDYSWSRQGTVRMYPTDHVWRLINFFIEHTAFSMPICYCVCAVSGWDVTKRLIVVESHWPYFLGFGLPITLLTSSCGSYWISGCAFSILFPLLIISAELANLPSVETWGRNFFLPSNLKTYDAYFIVFQKILFHRTVNLPIFLTTVAVANCIMSSVFSSSPNTRDMSSYSFHRIRLLLGRGLKNSLPCFKKINGRALPTPSAIYQQESQPFLLPQSSSVNPFTK